MCAFWSVSKQRQNAIIKLIAMQRLALFICGQVHSACDSDWFKINHTYDIRASSKRMMGPLIAIQAGIHRSHGECSLQLMENSRLFVFCKTVFSSWAFHVDIEPSHMAAGSSSFPLELRTLVPPLAGFKAYIMDMHPIMWFLGEIETWIDDPWITQTQHQSNNNCINWWSN